MKADMYINPNLVITFAHGSNMMKASIIGSNRLKTNGREKDFQECDAYHTGHG